MGIEAGADVATGALIGRAVEPRAGDAAHGHLPHETHCLNCGATLIGAHCHVCGQAAHVHRTMGAIGHEIAHGVFHFDGKIWRTLPLLALRPGELTRRYVDGERARFVSPLAIFLFSVFLMFAVVANLPGWGFDGDFLDPGTNGRIAQVRTKLGEERVKADQRIAETMRALAKERRDAEPDAERIAELEQRITETRKARGEIVSAERVLPTPTTLNAKGAPPPGAGNWLDAKFRHATENPKLLLYKVKTSAYKYSWALIPLSLPFVWLLFPFSRRYGMYDHAVFTTYSLTFMSLLTIVLALLGAIGVAWPALAIAATVIPPVHIYRQLKGAYRLGRWSALLRTIVLSMFVMAVIVPAFVLMLAYLGVAD